MKTRTKFTLIAIASFIGGVLYRLGGIGKPWNTKYRDFGVPIVALGLLALLGGTAPWWIWLLTFLCMFGVMTTYFEINKNNDTDWYEWLIVGFMFGLSALPYAWYNSAWIGLNIRTTILVTFVMFWSEIIKKDWLEEFGRGFLFIITLPLLLIGG